MTTRVTKSLEHTRSIVPLLNLQLPAQSCTGPGCGTAARSALCCCSAGAELSAAPETGPPH